MALLKISTRSKTIIFTLLLAFASIARPMHPLAYQIMDKLKEPRVHIALSEDVVRALSIDCYDLENRIHNQISHFFSSEEYRDLGVAYLTSLFTPSELEELLRGLEQDSFHGFQNSSTIRSKLTRLITRVAPMLLEHVNINR